MKLDDIPFVIRDIKNEMPFHSSTITKIPSSFSKGLPKNLNDFSSKINNKFLNNYLSTIEEIAYRFPNHNLPKWMKDYQNRYFKADLAHDGFFKHATNFDSRIKHRQHTNPFIEFRHVNGATLEVGSDTSNSGDQSNVLSCVTITGGVVGTYYNQVAFSVITAAGNYIVGIYDDSSGPHNILSQSSSVAVPSGYTYTSIPEVALTTSTLYIAFNSNSSSARYYYVTAGATGRYYGATTYGAFVNSPAGLSTATAQLHCKTGHS